jgi:hypothetical protein
MPDFPGIPKIRPVSVDDFFLKNVFVQKYYGTQGLILG